jgi:50S ribosomal protein L16 3-hydroxylase
MAMSTTRRLLGNHSPPEFLARYWHKEALLVKAAMPTFRGIIDRNELFALAARDDVRSRVVQRAHRRYQVDDGPFRIADLRRMPPRNWTLLVQSVNLHSDAADELLRKFSFLPYARLDDVMVSYATPGGGVGPHFDSYDVFLLQGEGRRRWRYGRQADLTLRPDAALRILRNFEPQHDATLAAGDMLYLPPDHAHDGTAVDACITYSIGFRAPLYQEVAEAFVDHVRDTIAIPGRYADPDLRRAPAGRIDARLRRRMTAAITQLRWSTADVARFIGCFLTELKPEVAFTRPPRPSRPAFERRIHRDGVRLDRRAQLLYDDTRYYLNGEDAVLPGGEGRRALRRLADRRLLTARECARLAPETLDLLYDWHRHGFLAAPGHIPAAATRPAA